MPHPAETPVTIPARHRGPTSSGNGGWVAGTLAAAIGPAATVTLRRPIPLDAPLRLLRHPDGGAHLLDGEALLAEAEPFDGPLDAPGPVSLAEARAASADPLVPDPLHQAPRCWVCGPLAPPEALHIRAGRVRPGLAAGLMETGPHLAAPDGLIDARHLWAALDCPSGVAAMAEEPGPIHETYLLLGRVSGRIERRPAPGAPLVVTARGEGREGRKLFAASALHDAGGNRIALARSIWIEVPPEKLLGAA